MSNAKNFDLNSLIPGFETFKKMAEQMPGVGQAVQGMKNPFLPNVGSWVAPTLSTEELEKRITELQTVKVWLESNAHLLEATIQALQVQKMTLATLESMKAKMGSWPFGMSTDKPTSPSAAKGASQRNKTHFDMGAANAQPAASTSQRRSKSANKDAQEAKEAETTNTNLPESPFKLEQAAILQQAGEQAMQMWAGLTQQFGQIASQTLESSQKAATELSQQAAKAAKAAQTAAKPPARSAAKPSKKAAAQKAAVKKTVAQKATAKKTKRST